eukprot:superscaffoldBa00007340_g22440
MDIDSMMRKHVVIQAPSSSGSLHYNYKGTISIVLLAVVDAHYVFWMIDVGRTSDGGALYNSAFGDGTLDLLPDAAPTSPENRMFNYCLSCARLVVQDACGILSSQWRMYWRVTGLGYATAELCVKATCILHNVQRLTAMREAGPGWAPTSPHGKPFE